MTYWPDFPSQYPQIPIRASVYSLSLSLYLFLWTYLLQKKPAYYQDGLAHSCLLLTVPVRYNHLEHHSWKSQSHTKLNRRYHDNPPKRCISRYQFYSFPWKRPCLFLLLQRGLFWAFLVKKKCRDWTNCTNTCGHYQLHIEGGFNMVIPSYHLYTHVPF